MSDEKLVIALKLDKVKPDELALNDVAELIKKLFNLFKDISPTFQYVQSGSSYFGCIIQASDVDKAKAE